MPKRACLKPHQKAAQIKFALKLLKYFSFKMMNYAAFLQNASDGKAPQVLYVPNSNVNASSHTEPGPSTSGASNSNNQSPKKGNGYLIILIRTSLRFE